MRLDIHQEQPRRREEGDNASGSSGDRSVMRKPPDNPVLHRLKSLEQSTTGHRVPRPQAERKRVEQTSMHVEFSTVVLPHRYPIDILRPESQSEEGRETPYQTPDETPCSEDKT